MNVIAGPAQIPSRTLIDWLCFITASKQMTPVLVTSIEPLRISAQKPFHSQRQIGLWCFQNQMKMICHERISMRSPTSLQTNLTKCAQEIDPVIIFMENGFL